MNAEKNKRLRQQTFVFHKPLTKVPPAIAGNGARQRGEPELKSNELPAIAGSKAR